MKRSVAEVVRAKILASKRGSIFAISDFAGLNQENVGHVLAAIARQGKIIRLAQGIYVKPKMTRLGPLMPSVDEVVAAIAKRDCASVIPTGATAANNLGLSTQVPRGHVYLTSGTARTMKVGKTTVKLMRRSPKNFVYQGNLIPQIIQALKWIGEDNLEERDLARIRHLLSENPETSTFEHDVKYAPLWINKLLKQLRMEAIK
jgi:hypothetical protein